MSKNKKMLSLTLYLFVVILLIIGLLLTHIHHVMNQSSTVSTEQIESSNKLIFFKDDCRDCQKELPKIIIKNLFNTKTLYINLNNEKNKKYINDYHLKEVPTIVKEGENEKNN